MVGEVKNIVNLNTNFPIQNFFYNDLNFYQNFEAADIAYSIYQQCL